MLISLTQMTMSATKTKHIIMDLLKRFNQEHYPNGIPGDMAKLQAEISSILQCHEYRYDGLEVHSVLTLSTAHIDQKNT